MAPSRKTSAEDETPTEVGNCSVRRFRRLARRNDQVVGVPLKLLERRGRHGLLVMAEAAAEPNRRCDGNGDSQ